MCLQNQPTFGFNLNAKLGREVSAAERASIQDSFESEVIDYLSNLWKKRAGTRFGPGEEFADQDVFFNLDRSIADVVALASELETGLLVGGYIVMLVYAFLVYTNYRNSVYSHGFLSAGSVIIIAFSTAASLGLTAWFGIRFSPISSNVIPFIALGIGIDDAFVIITAYTREVVNGGTARDILGRTMGEAGPSVLFTSIVNFVAFGVGSSMPILVVELFCQQMMVSVFLNFMFIMLLLLPCVYLDCSRTLSGTSENCSGCGKDNDPEKKESLLSVFYGDYYAPLLMKDIVRVLVLVLFALFFALLAWQGFEENEATLRISTGTYSIFKQIQDLDTWLELLLLCLANALLMLMLTPDACLQWPPMDRISLTLPRAWKRTS